jgi:hypothetical protein
LYLFRISKALQMANVPPKQAPAACFGAVGKATIVFETIVNRQADGRQRCNGRDFSLPAGRIGQLGKRHKAIPPVNITLPP